MGLLYESWTCQWPSSLEHQLFVILGNLEKIPTKIWPRGYIVKVTITSIIITTSVANNWLASKQNKGQATLEHKNRQLQQKEIIRRNLAHMPTTWSTQMSFAGRVTEYRTFNFSVRSRSHCMMHAYCSRFPPLILNFLLTPAVAHYHVYGELVTRSVGSY